MAAPEQDCPSREELLSVAREVDRARGVPTLSTEDHVGHVLDIRARRGVEDLRRMGAPDEPTFRRNLLATLRELRDSWTAQDAGAGERLLRVLSRPHNVEEDTGGE